MLTSHSFLLLPFPSWHWTVMSHYLCKVKFLHALLHSHTPHWPSLPVQPLGPPVLSTHLPLESGRSCSRFFSIAFVNDLLSLLIYLTAWIQFFFILFFILNHKCLRIKALAISEEITSGKIIFLNFHQQLLFPSVTWFLRDQELQIGSDSVTASVLFGVRNRCAEVVQDSESQTSLQPHLLLHLPQSLLPGQSRVSSGEARKRVGLLPAFH